MREIKFRARNAKLPIRCWVYGYFVIEKGCSFIVNEEGRFLVIAGSQNQYTNLKDKQGKKIYFDDLVLMPDKRVYQVRWSSFLGKIFLDSLDKKGTSYFLKGFQVREGILVGNNYENSELKRK